MVYSSLLASVFVAIVFSTGLLGAIKASDSRREGRGVAAAAYAALAVVGVLLAERRDRLRPRADRAQVLEVS